MHTSLIVTHTTQHQHVCGFVVSADGSAPSQGPGLCAVDETIIEVGVDA